MRVSRLKAGVLVAVLMAGLGDPASTRASGDTERVLAFLGSEPISIGEVATVHCHDFEYPVLRCYRTADALHGAVAEIDGVLALSYVRVFKDASFAGASVYLSQNYTDLRTIGWNDIISSYRVVNYGSGTLYEHIEYQGLADSFCCNELVSNVGASFNDKFSSVHGFAS